MSLIFGVAYYPEYMPYERISTDIAWMKEAGINTVRMAESTWSTWEREEGKFDFSLLVKTLDAMEEAGMQVIIGTPTYAVPSWLVKKDPSVMAETKEGVMPYGARQIMDILNPTYRFHAKRLIEELLQVTKEYSCVIGYQLDNETKYYGCLSPLFQKGFVESLKERFGTVEALNEAYGLAYWSNAIGSWEDFPDVRGTINASLGAAFDDYRRQVAADFLAWQREMVEPFLREGQFVTQNLDFSWEPIEDVAPGGCSYGVQRGIYHYAASKALTLCGTDVYHPSQEALTGEEIAFGGDIIWPLKEKPYLVLETQAQAFPEWTPFPGQLYLQAISHLASGALGMMYWNWHSIHNSFETYWRGVLSHDLHKNRIYQEASKIGAIFAKLSPYLEGFQRSAKVALLVDNVSQDALTWFPMHGNVSYNDLVRMYHRYFYRHNIAVDIVDARAFLESYGEEKEIPYEVVVTPGLYSVSEEMVSLLRDFVKKGGTLLSSCRSFVANRDLKVYADTLPYGMTEVFGASYQELTRSGTTLAGGEPLLGFMELLMPGKGAEVLLSYEHPYWGEYAALVRHSYGKGTGIYVSGLLDEKVLFTVLQKSLPSDLGQADASLTFPLVVKRGINGKGERISFVLNYDGENRFFTWDGGDAKDLTSERRISSGQEVCLPGWSAAVLWEG